jgi:hypothetical protein
MEEPYRLPQDYVKPNENPISMTLQDLLYSGSSHLIKNSEIHSVLNYDFERKEMLCAKLEKV